MATSGPICFVVFFVVVWFALASAAEESETIKASLLWTKENGFQVRHNELSLSEDTVAWATFKNEINQTGWTYLEVKTSGKFEDSIQAYAAGYLEAYLTADLIHLYWRNIGEKYCHPEGMEEICNRMKEFVKENTKWYESMVAIKWPVVDQTCDPYWHHVQLAYEQMKGLQDMYDEQVNNSVENAVMFVNIWHDFDDLVMAIKHQQKLNVELLDAEEIGSWSCSALIKLLPEELFTAHTTWTSFNRMLRIMKRYDFDFRQTLNKEIKEMPGRVTAFSGYPGAISSGDDFNAMFPSRLASMETTIGNKNVELWKFVQPNDTLFMGIRSTVANWMANDGEEWTRIFAEHNSGTYNNEWMIVDYKKLDKKDTSKSRKGLLWVLDQIPGHVKAEDRTEQLLKNKYFPSYNLALFPQIFNLSGGQGPAEQYGDWWTYDNAPRAKIFKRDHSNITDIEGMVKLMRQNNFLLEDPLSACDNCMPKYNAMNAIAARGDLNPANGTYPFKSLTHRNHGATDLKIVSNELINNGVQFKAISGPTSQNVPAFEWDKTGFKINYFGMPNKFDFPPVTHEWTLHLQSSGSRLSTKYIFLLAFIIASASNLIH